MKRVKVTTAMAKHWVPGSPPARCPLCPNKIRVGQWVLSHRLAPRDFVDTTINIHVACAAAAIEDCPDDDVDPTSIAAAKAAHRRASKREARLDRERAA